MARDFVRRVLIVEDEALLRALLKSTLENHGFEVESASDAMTAKRMVNRFDPDVMVVDIDLGEGLNGLELVSALGRQDSTRGYVILSNYSASVKNVPEVPYISYLNKQVVETPEILIGEIEGVLRGRTREFETSESPKLTPAQMDVLRMLSEGLTNKQIAEKKGHSTRGVEQLLARTYLSLGLNSESGQSRRVLAVQFYKQLTRVNR
ncbi:MAG TPA: response regulator transcription factor [Microbacteriaceae bacterium]